MTNFNLRLKFVRLSRGWTQKTLAKHAGISIRRISLIEAGYVQPYIDEVEAISKALEVEQAELWPDLKDCKTDGDA